MLKSKPNKFIWRAPHHLYFGIVVIIAGAVLHLFSWLSIPYYLTSASIFTTWGYILNVVGGLIVLDDIIEHTITNKTPLRWFFKKFNFWLK